MPEPSRGPAGGTWLLRGGSVSLDRPVLLGILNVTPDSFSDGGRYLSPAAALDRARELVAAGADLLDVGAESTRPGADPVSAEEEWSRLGPVLPEVAELGVPVSVDTTKGEIARRALEAGAAVVNDVSGLVADPEIADVAAEFGAGLVLMHMRGTPRSMQDDVRYDDLCGEVRAFLGDALGRALERGCAPGQIVLDPGIGFGKSAEANLQLIARAAEFGVEGRPVLLGPSRKSFLGRFLDAAVEERDRGTTIACVAGLFAGARLFRVHEVGSARDALDFAERIRRAGTAPADPVATEGARRTEEVGG